MAQAQLSRSETPENITNQSITYTNNAYPSARATKSTNSHGLSPTISLFHYIRINDKNIFTWNANYTYNKNKYQYNYTEGAAMPIINDVKENYHNVDMKATYVHVFGKSDQLQATLWGGYSNSNSDYKGTSPNKQQLSEGFLQFLPTYTHRFGRNLALT